jgi:glycosyltransferase involved in cell wall biosynthesis
MYETVFRMQDRGRTRLALDCHNIEPHEKRPGDGVLIRRMTQASNSFIVHSKSVAETLGAYRTDPITTLVPLPLSANFPDGPGRGEARRRLGLADDVPVLLFFGFVRAYKGLDLAVEALAHLAPDTHLVVAGEFYESGDAYRNRAAELAPDRVRFVEDFIPSEEVGVYFDACDVVVLPYHRATQSGVLPLAWRFAAPAVATAVGGLTEVVTPDETGVLVPPHDPAAFADGVRRALDPVMNATIRRNLADGAGDLSWERAAAAVVEQITLT